MVHVRQLENNNDPNTSPNLLDYGSKDAWVEFLKK
jgi:hypothetical protein